ncbi:MAG: DUF58 domain-containing protein [bacterium]
MVNEDNTQLNQDTIDAVRNLELIPDMMTSSRYTGIHSSRDRGSDVEFAEHRQYEPGDDLRYLDWNALAKSDELFLKQFESETQIDSSIVLDASKSMDYASGELSKWEVARAVSVMMSSVLLDQGDRVKIVPARKDSVDIPRWNNINELSRDLDQLETMEATGPTVMLDCSKQELSNVTSKSLWIIVSDFWMSNENEYFDWLQNVKTRGHDVILIPVWDPIERVFEVDGDVQLEDLETGETVTVTGDDVERFRDALEDKRSRFERIARENQIRFWPIYTDRDIVPSLRTHVGSEGAR